MSQTSLFFFLVREKTVSLFSEEKAKTKRGGGMKRIVTLLIQAETQLENQAEAETDCTTATSCWSDALRHASVRGAETSFFLALPHIWLTCSR